MLLEQMLDQGAGATEDAITLAAIGQRHDGLLVDIGGAQVEFTAGTIAEVHEILGRESLADDRGIVLPVLVEPLIVVLAGEFASDLGLVIGGGAWMAVTGVTVGRVMGGWQARRAAIYSSVSFAAIVVLYVAFRVAETNGGGRFL